MSDASEIADLLARVASVRDRLGRAAFLRAVARARIAVALTVLDEAESGAGLTRGGGAIIPFRKRGHPDRPGETR